jgi:hypothetical protein
MTLRWTGAAVAVGGCTAILWWGATAGSNPTAVAGSFDLPAVGFLVVILGFFVWLAGMVRGERRERSLWRELDRREAPPGYFDTLAFDALSVARAPSAGGAASAASARPSSKRRSSRMPVPRQDPRPVRPEPSPVALAVLDSIELRRETGEDPLPAAVEGAAVPQAEEPAMPRPATAAARARA